MIDHRPYRSAAVRNDGDLDREQLGGLAHRQRQGHPETLAELCDGCELPGRRAQPPQYRGPMRPVSATPSLWCRGDPAVPAHLATLSRTTTPFPSITTTCSPFRRGRERCREPTWASVLRSQGQDHREYNQKIPRPASIVVPRAGAEHEPSFIRVGLGGGSPSRLCSSFPDGREFSRGPTPLIHSDALPGTRWRGSCGRCNHANDGRVPAPAWAASWPSAWRRSNSLLMITFANEPRLGSLAAATAIQAA